MYSTTSQSRAPFFAIKLLPKFHTGIEVEFLAWARRTLRPIMKMLRIQLQAWVPHLSASPTEGLNSFAQLFYLTKTDGQKNRGKTPKIGKRKTGLSG